MEEMFAPLGFEIYPFKVIHESNFLNISIWGKCSTELTNLLEPLLLSF